MGWANGWGVLAALLALALNVAVPPGFMVGPAKAGAAIVICTGHGPQAATPAGTLGHGQRHAGGHGQACAFAGHGTLGASPITPIIGGAALPAHVQTADARGDLVPGRGLAAPPPPPRGPPIVLT